jgi:AcrR family transcriptional regulator
MDASAVSARVVASSARRRVILAAALKLFTRKGFAATSIDDIRQASGASVGSIYHHFGDKAGVAAALYAESLGDYQRGVLALLSERPAAREGIEGMVRHHLRWIASHPHEARFLFGMRSAEVLLASRKELRAMNRTFFREMFGWLAEQADAGRIRKVRRNLYFPLVIGPGQELARQWLEGLVEEPLEEAAPVLAEAAWNAVRTGGRR